ncbi:MAG: hypothetical protein KDB96_09820 [Flavobacteriales bacterium]|nr:hypothetical protein [Flavobacteriales bacterium]
MKHLLILVALSCSSLSLAQADGIYVSDAGGFQNPPWQIVRYDLDGQDPQTFIADSLNWPQDILFLEDSNVVLISNLGSGQINRHDATTGAFLSHFATGIGGPTRMRIGPDSALYVLQWTGNGRVRRYALDGSYLGEFTSVTVPQSIGLDWDNAGNLYVSSYTQDHVRRFDPQGNDLGLFITTNLAGPTNVWSDTDSTLMVADYDGNAVKRFDLNGNYLGVFIGGLGKTEGYAYFPDGSLLLGNGITHSVKRFDVNGAFLGDIVPNGSGGLQNPNAIVVRGTPMTAIPERGTSHHPLTVKPTVGRHFEIATTHRAGLVGLEVRSVDGVRVVELEGMVWEADTVAPGTYLIVGHWNDGALTSRRVLVSDR